MSTRTTNLNLIKPELTDNIAQSIADFNTNSDILDSAVYKKPDGGIPSTDLASAVQTSLGKADTALQEHQSLSAYRTSVNQDAIDATLQPKTDNTLTTTAQTIVGAINEHEGDISTLKADKADKAQLSNRNLLDNGWFQVNQRDQSSYSLTAMCFLYTVDRWVGYTGYESKTISVSSNGITIPSLTSLNQRFEYENLIGKTVTASLMYSDGTIVSGTKTIVNGNNLIYDGIVQIYYNILSDISFNINVPNNTTTIKAVKLELGSVSTLHMDTAPNYAEELLKCQRYFVRLKNVGETYSYPPYAHGFTIGSSMVLLHVILPTTMRTNPTVVLNAVSPTLFDNTFLQGFDITQVKSSGNTIRIQGTFTNGQTAGYCVHLQGYSSNSFIDFSADL